MKTPSLLTISLAAFVLALSACSKTDAPGAAPTAAAAATASSGAPAAAAPNTPAKAYELLAEQGKGFTVGAVMAANTTYVLFDPQCPHCGHLWMASIPLHKKAKFVWMPVAIMNGKSAGQGVALLSAANPAELMTAHETSLIAGTGGLPAPASMPPELEASIKNNTKLFGTLGADSVPYIVGKNTRTGQAVIRGGALDTASLAALLGVDAP